MPTASAASVPSVAPRRRCWTSTTTFPPPALPAPPTVGPCLACPVLHTRPCLTAHGRMAATPAPVVVVVVAVVVVVVVV